MRAESEGAVSGALSGIKDRIVGVFKFDYSTVRELEHKCFRVFYFVGGMVVVGFVMMITQILAFVGVPLMVLGILLFFITLVWMLKLTREPTREAFCPYCSTKNEVFVTRREFICDMCQRPIGVLPSGQIVPLETPEERDARLHEKERGRRHEI